MGSVVKGQNGCCDSAASCQVHHYFHGGSSLSLEGSITRRNGGALPISIISNICTLLRHYKLHNGRHPPAIPFFVGRFRRKTDANFYVGFTSVFFRRFATLNADDTKTGKAPHSIERFYGTDRQNENANYNPLSISRFSIFCDFAKQKRSSTSRFRFSLRCAE